MNKSELIEIISEKSRVPKKKAEEVVNLVFDSMTEALVKGDRIEIRGFGSFVNREYGQYTGRNPRTGESIQVLPKKLPFFKVGKELKERVDGTPGSAPGGRSGPLSTESSQATQPTHNPGSH
jgi:Bacterial nucleoid DNA-binding protein